MATDATDRFALPLLNSGQAQKEVAHNEALALVDALIHAQVETVSATAPPGGETAGQCWLVAAGASGAWAGHDDALACYTGGGWRFVPPRDGMRIWASDEGLAYLHDGTAWARAAARPDGYYVGGQKIIGARAAAIADATGGSNVDAEARAALNQLLAAARVHGLIG